VLTTLEEADVRTIGHSRCRRSSLASLRALAVLAVCSPSLAQDGPPGLTTPVVLPAFDPSAKACTPPPDLEKVLAFAQDNQREFMNGVGRGLAAAAKDRGLGFRVELAANDAARMIEQVQALRTAKIGAVVAAPVDAPSLAKSLQQMIWSGAYVGTVVPPPATTLLNAPQYLTGKVLAEAAAAHIRDKLGGKAKVVLLTHDSLQFLAPRFTAMRDTLKDMPGVVIVADISPTTVNKEGGQATMRTILLAQPNVDVVLGADTVVLGALAALREAGKARADQFLGGIDGEAEAVAEIKKGGGPYMASISLASSVFGYAMGQHAADWLEGKSIPQAMNILPKALTVGNIVQYERDTADPGAVYADPARQASYLKMYGNICYDTRERYVNFPWSSERK
jgi:ribose transport system substrate-binding protein